MFNPGHDPHLGLSVAFSLTPALSRWAREPDRARSDERARADWRAGGERSPSPSGRGLG